MDIVSRKIVEWTLLFFSGGAAVLGFASVSADTGRWLLPSLLFSVLAVGFLAAGMLYRERSMRVAFIALAIGPSVLFAWTLSHLFLMSISVAFMLSGFRKMEYDLRSRLALSFRKSMGAGVFMFALPISILIASQYYAEIRSNSWQDLVPRFSLAEGGGDMVLRIAGSISPEIGKIRDERMTVDSFLSTVRRTDGYSGSNTGMLADDMAMALSIEAGRAELGKLVGRDLSGDERMSDVLSEALRNKTIAFLSGERAERDLPGSALPFFLAVLLFITILSIASLLQGVWVLLAAGLLRLLVRSGVLSIEKIPAEQETLR
jgi:hypothetical protein